MLSRLNGLDRGPESQFMNIPCNWEKKIISSSGNRMMIEFRADDSLEWSGFSASISYYPLQSDECNSWLNTNEGTLKTPDYSNSYDNTISCKWLITVKHGYYISLKFMEFEVIFLKHFRSFQLKIAVISPNSLGPLFLVHVLIKYS